MGLAELLLSGCTTVFDHTYLYQNGNSVDVQVEAAREIGVRFHASRGSMSVGRSKGGLPPDEAVEDEAFILKDSERVIDRFHDPRPGAMTRVVLAPCAPFSVSADLLRESAALARARGVRLHTHLAETLDEERYTLERFGVRPVEWMDGLGWVAGDVWFAHAVHVSDGEISRFARAGCGVAHCPSSNMRLASGIAPVKKYLRAGVAVGLAVDGSASNDASNMLLEARQAMLLARLELGLRRESDGPPGGLDERPRGAGARDARRGAGAGPRRRRLARGREVRRLLQPRPRGDRLRRGPPRPGGGHRLLRADPRAPDRRSRPGGGGGRPGRHRGHGAGRSPATTASRRRSREGELLQVDDLAVEEPREDEQHVLFRHRAQLQQRADVPLRR